MFTKADFLSNRKKVIVKVFAVMFMIYCGTFGFVDLFINRITAAVILFITTLLNAAAFYFNEKNLVNVSSRIILTAGVFLYSFLFYDGGIAGTGILWIFTYPNFAFYLRGRNEGTFWILSLFTVILILTITSIAGIIILKYKPIYVGIGMTIYFLLSFLAYFYEYTRHKSEQSINDKNEKLSRYNKELKKRDRIIFTDLSLSKRIQTAIIDFDDDILKDLAVKIHFQPMMQVGGDIFDICKIREGYYRFFLADAIGHGVQAAFITIIIKSEYNNVKTRFENPDEILTELNKNFITKYYKLTVFFTCVVMDIDLNNSKIKYSSAGHPSQILIENNEIKKLDAGGKLVGLMHNADYDLIEREIQPDSKIFLFTDGLFEQFNVDGAEFGEENLFSLIHKYRDHALDKSVDNVVKDIQEWSEGKESNDDITVIGITRV